MNNLAQKTFWRLEEKIKKPKQTKKPYHRPFDMQSSHLRVPRETDVFGKAAVDVTPQNSNLFHACAAISNP